MGRDDPGHINHTYFSPVSDPERLPNTNSSRKKKIKKRPSTKCIRQWTCHIRITQETIILSVQKLGKKQSTQTNTDVPVKQQHMRNTQHATAGKERKAGTSPVERMSLYLHISVTKKSLKWHFSGRGFSVLWRRSACLVYSLCRAEGRSLEKKQHFFSLVGTAKL